jgi:diguanylate cyclase (GGDEF)-like protein
VHPRQLAILIPRRAMPLLKQWVNGYWAYSSGFDANGQPAPPGSATIEVQVLEPAKANVIRLQNQSSLMLSLFTTVLVVGALVSEVVGRLVLSEFRKILQPLQVAGPGATGSAIASHLIPTLSLSAVGELRALVDQINARIARLNLLTGELQQANQALAASRDELATLSRTDSLTHCLNRRALDDQLGTALLQARRRGEPLSLLCFDIDNFKVINDSHGHPVGDQVLRTVAECVRTRLRATDAFFRIGGEEFVILLPDCSELDALQLAEQHRRLVSQAETPAPDGPLRVTISVGVSDFRPTSDSAESLMERVDRALYLAKRAGRNQVVHQ